MKNTKDRLILLSILVLAPLAVAVIAFWQMRGLPERRFYEDTLPLLKAALYDGVPDTHVPAATRRIASERSAEVRRLVESAPRRQLIEEYARLERYAVLRYVPWVSFSALSLALLASATGALGMLFVSFAGKRSLRSRDALYLWFARGVRLLPLMLLGLSLPLILSLVGVGVSAVLRGYASPSGFSARDVCISIVVTALALVAGALTLKARLLLCRLQDGDPDAISGTTLSPEAAPMVWEMVEDVARKGGLPLPERIVMGFESGFHVTRGITRGAADDMTRTTLYLYLPLMLVMGEDELRSVVAHELGHLRAADLEYRERFGAIYLSAHRAIRLLVSEHSVDRYSIAIFAAAERLALFFLDAFHTADMHWSREREFAADSVAASVAGGDATALALVRSALYMPHIASLIEAFRWQGVGGDLIASLRERLSSVTPDALESVLESEQPHLFDTHPCLRERLAQLGAESGAGLGERAADVDPGALLLRLGL